MIQNFEVQGGPALGRENLPKLRKVLSANRLDGLLVPHQDEYNNEYLPDHNKRLMWVSGFTGSAGFAVVLKKRAAIFVDGRYTLQVRDQVDTDLFEIHSLENNGVTQWLADSLKKGLRIGYDPKLLSPDALTRLNKAVTKNGAKLIAMDENPIDIAWSNRPPAPRAKLSVQPKKYAGLDHEAKRERIAEILRDKGADATVLTSPASIAWLLNVRGGDVMCTPLPLSNAIVHNDGKAELFIDPQKITKSVKKHLGNAVSISPEQALPTRLKAMRGKTIHLDPAITSSFIFDTLTSAGATIQRGMDPVALPKAQKNRAEIKGTTNAHIRDGAAVCNFLHWVDTQGQTGQEDEISAAIRLEAFRQDTGALKDLSFESISGYGSNGAICHYRVSTATNLRLKKGSLYLIDSGGQYIDGTTDITRTVPIGKPSKEMRHAFTLVLKGHIALSQVKFPEGTSGHALDALARQFLWAQGLDYDHGTGHGVGVYLGVHEGPQRIADRPNAIALKPGMIVSNEPGYYKAGQFGIRIENLQYVTAPEPVKGGERPMMGFETLTLAPINQALFMPELLSRAEIQWLNAYHRQVKTTLLPLVNTNVKSWLRTACKPIKTN